MSPIAQRTDDEENLEETLFVRLQHLSKKRGSYPTNARNSGCDDKLFTVTVAAPRQAILIRKFMSLFHIPALLLLRPDRTPQRRRGRLVRISSSNKTKPEGYRPWRLKVVCNETPNNSTQRLLFFYYFWSLSTSPPDTVLDTYIVPFDSYSISELQSSRFVPFVAVVSLSRHSESNLRHLWL